MKKEFLEDLLLEQQERGALDAYVVYDSTGSK